MWLDKGLVWCPEPDTLAKHMAETVTNSGLFGKPMTVEQGQLEPSDLHDLKFIEVAWPLATTKQQRRAPGRLWFKEKRRIKRLKAKHNIQRPIEVKYWSWNDKTQRCRVFVGEMVDKDGNIWASDDWPKMVHQHVVDLHKALEDRDHGRRNVSSRTCPME